jgi:hypothetical protein
VEVDAVVVKAEEEWAANLNNSSSNCNLVCSNRPALLNHIPSQHSKRLKWAK